MKFVPSNLPVLVLPTVQYTLLSVVLMFDTTRLVRFTRENSQFEAFGGLRYSDMKMVILTAWPNDMARHHRFYYESPSADGVQDDKLELLHHVFSVLTPCHGQ